jgi:hypothetical protein
MSQKSGRFSGEYYFTTGYFPAVRKAAPQIKHAIKLAAF